jgi:transposase-like protein
VKDKKFTEIEEKGIAFMIATGQYTQKEAAEKHNVAPSTIHKIYHKYKNSVENDVEKGKSDSFDEKTIFDTDEVRLINKTLMKKNEALRETNEILQTAVDGYRLANNRNAELTPNAENLKKHLDEMLRIYIEKNAKYGNSYTKTYQEYGNTALLLRIDDKLSRAKQLLLKRQSGTADESIIDTLIDMANYAIMGVMELEKNETT